MNWSVTGSIRPPDCPAALTFSSRRCAPFCARIAHSSFRTLRDAKRGNLTPEDEVYIGTWLRILEREKREAGDGTVEEALGNLDDVSIWPAKLRAWTLGQIDAKALTQFATTPSQRTEALFYQSMQLRIDGKMTESHDLLDQVVKSPTVELVELTIARDLLRAASNQIPPQLPTDVTVP